MLTIHQTLKEIIIQSMEDAFPEEYKEAKSLGLKLDPQFANASKPDFGDFQLNGAFSLAKKLKKSPIEIAEEIIKQLSINKEFNSLCEKPKIAGPGFINISLRKETLTNEVLSRINDPRLGVESVNRDSNSRVVIDFSSPNIAKEMHVGHLRSTIIGDCLSRIFEFRGHKVIRLNHVGDWGTQFGMLITHLKIVAPEALKTSNAVEIGDLVAFYKEAKKIFDIDKDFKIKARREVVRLQQGEEDSIKAWELLCDQSRKEFQKIYDRLNINIRERGESFYNSYLKDVIKNLERKGLLITDEGAKCVFLKNLTGKNGKPLPVIVQKSDGGFNYSTTDLAALRYRLNQPPKGDGATRVLYVTDSGQTNHFEGIFQIARKANWIPPNVRVEHVPFGVVQGEDGKKLKTRSGETIRLAELLDRAVSHAETDLRERIAQEDRQEDENFIQSVSETVGLAAIKYADLSQNRISNYQFSFKKMLSLQGNTAPYLLYALVRIAGIYRKGGDFKRSITKLEFNEPQEFRLIRDLIKFDEIIEEVEEELLPNRLCSYLFELSQVFNRFYDQIPILNSKQSYRESRLILCKLTADTLTLGLHLLGISPLERM